MRVVLAQPRGFCAGVVRAIEIVERALAKGKQPVYVRHEIVHNRHVVEDLPRGRISSRSWTKSPTARRRSSAPMAYRNRW
jgi:4-hydroxy-3-methylbut-2-enyl diphosphate reductase IspH